MGTTQKKRIVASTWQWSLTASWDENRDFSSISPWGWFLPKPVSLEEDWTPDEKLVLVDILILAQWDPEQRIWLLCTQTSELQKL